MAEYIEREDAYNVLTEYYHHSTEVQHEALREAIERVPFADVQPVVYCKDCKHRPTIEYGDIIAPRIGNGVYGDYTCPYLCGDEYYNRLPSDNEFCSHGERMDCEVLVKYD